MRSLLIRYRMPRNLLADKVLFLGFSQKLNSMLTDW